MDFGPLELLVIQGTPFCNINCTYCYLPNRTDNSKISAETISKLFERLFSSKLVNKDFTVTWHAGEPLVLGIEFYQKAFEIINNLNYTPFKVRHNFQTNGTLLTEEWCEFIIKNNIAVSVSCDGPKILHDKYRIKRNGQGTFDLTLKGINLLKKNNIQFDIISVVTNETLNYPDEYFDFFHSVEPRILGLNIEEIEGVNKHSTLYSNSDFLASFHTFYNKILDLYDSHSKKFKIRELFQLENFILNSDKYMEGFGQQTTPYRILNVASNGDFSTFSPELLTMSNNSYENENFVIGNVYNDDFEEALNSDKLQSIYSDIISGIYKCKLECKYFSVCGGGTPSNKYFENGSFDSTETSFCRIRFKSMFDIVYNRLEKMVG